VQNFVWLADALDLNVQHVAWLAKNSYTASFLVGDKLRDSMHARIDELAKEYQ